ncbi:bleomycin resistance protein [Larkinella sp. VNQ87]|uniref:bleomycin resistance protein n=1 Tax=Larkinella sp. VNQ87 TaxID=3400921 RepID=UPI003BFF6594
MLTAVHPKLPMRNKRVTEDFYLTYLGFEKIGQADFPDYLMIRKDGVELHFFAFEDLDPTQNYGQVYLRTDAIDVLYQSVLKHPETVRLVGPLQLKPWGQKEFAVLDPDHNLLTFGQSV